MSIVKDTTSLVAGVLQRFFKVIFRYQELTAAALTQSSKPANIISRVYIQQDVAADDVALPLLSTLNQLYASYIITALNMQNIVVNGHTVRELYGSIATENLGDIIAVIGSDFGQEVLDLEIAKFKAIDLTASAEATGLVDLEKDSVRLTTGRLLELDLTLLNASGTRDNCKTYVYVQLIPIVLSEPIARGLLNLNFCPPLTQRWRQVQAKEISFWKDFIMSRDLLAKHEKLIKEDKTGTLFQILSNQNNKLSKWGRNIATSVLNIGTKSSNIANSIVIMERQTFNAACREVGVDFSNKQQRQAFMYKTMTIFVVVVDLSAGMVDLYFNGIDVKGTYTFQMVNKVGAKGKDAFSLAEVMQTFSQGMSPKF